MSRKICIIGSGLAGGVLAHQLLKNNENVVLVEQGDVPTPLEPTDENWILDAPKAAFTRGKGIGGTSNFWHGGLTTLDRVDVEGCSEFFDEPKIPVSYDELTTYYKKALGLINPGFNIDDVYSSPGNKDSDFIINSEYFKYKGIIYPKTVFSSKNLLDRNLDNNKLEIINNFHVKKIIFKNDESVSYLIGENTLTGMIDRIDADIFILCSGGLGSPKILLRSISDDSYLKDLPVGKYIIDHPTGFVFKAKLRRRMNLKGLFGQDGDGFRLQRGFTMSTDKLSLVSNKNHILYLRPAITMKDPIIYDFLKRKLVGYKGKRLNFSDLLYLIQNTDLLYEAVNFKYGLFSNTRHVSGLTFLEQVPDSNESISLNANGSFSIKWSVSGNDAASANKFMEIFNKSHSNIFDEFKLFPALDKRLETAGHHSGACRMSLSAKNGVVDSNLKVHGVSNLYVADGSVLGYSGHANTGLTIIALAMKCANNIISK